MAVRRHQIEIPRLPDTVLAGFQDVPAAVASDAQDRGWAMQAAISPLAPTMRIVAQARTVNCMAADNSALHAAIALAEPGQVIVCDAKGYVDNALFGGLLAKSSTERGLAGLVIDGAVRDCAEIIELGYPCYARAVTPRGPHKGFGGVIDGPVACGGLPVHPGDLIVADADGVTVVPFARAETVLESANAILAKEAHALETVANGGTLAEVYGVPDVEDIV